MSTSNDSNSIIIDLALDHFDYYTPGSVALLAGSCWTAAVDVHLVMGQVAFRHDLEVEYFVQRSLDVAASRETT